mgnify:CR=1 FL=1
MILYRYFLDQKLKAIACLKKLTGLQHGISLYDAVLALHWGSMQVHCNQVPLWPRDAQYFFHWHGFSYELKLVEFKWGIKIHIFFSLKRKIELWSNSVVHMDLWEVFFSRPVYSSILLDPKGSDLQDLGGSLSPNLGKFPKWFHEMLDESGFTHVIITLEYSMSGPRYQPVADNQIYPGYSKVCSSRWFLLWL